jgi:hypothetical protein
MQYLGIGLFAVGFIAVMWLFGRLMTSNERNEGSKHGGGMDDIGTRGDSQTPDF